jgi:hypothetical protein
MIEFESNGHRNLELVYGRADGMPNSLQSMVVCDCETLENDDV